MSNILRWLFLWKFKIGSRQFRIDFWEHTRFVDKEDGRAIGILLHNDDDYKYRHHYRLYMCFWFFNLCGVFEMNHKGRVLGGICDSY